MTDCWEKRTISKADITISEEEAVSLARKTAKNYSYNFADRIIDDLKILDDPVFTELSMQIRDKETVENEEIVYPLWYIRLCLAEVYPGLVTEIRVSIWADTGELAYITAAGSLGGPSSIEPVSINSNTSQTQIQTQSYALIIGIISIVTLTIFASGLFIWKKNKK